VNETEIEIGF